MAEVGVYDFLNHFMRPTSKPLLQSVCESLGLPERESSEDMVKSIADEVCTLRFSELTFQIMLGGSENFLTSLRTDTLVKLANDLNVSIPPPPIPHEKL
jgi:hypothetical protein